MYIGQLNIFTCIYGVLYVYIRLEAVDDSRLLTDSFFEANTSGKRRFSAEK